MAITPIGLTKDEFNTLIDELFCSKPKGCSCKKEEEPKEKKKDTFLERKNKRISAMVSQMSLEELRELEEAVEIADRIIERLKY